MSARVYIRQLDIEINVEPGETILQAALAAGLEYPFGCQSGNCGACKSKLLQGEVEMAEFSEYALSPEEQRAGLILACRAMAWDDCRVAWLELDETVQHPLRSLDCRVSDIVQATHDIRILTLAIEGMDNRSGGPFTYAAGQYASLTFQGQPARDYSMANRPGESSLQFHIRAMPDGAVSQYVENQVAVGDHVALQGPMGLAFFRANHTGPIIAAAGGSGLAPIKAILDEALHRGVAQPLHFYFGVRDARDLYLEDYFRTLQKDHSNLHFTPMLSEPSTPSSYRHGFIAEAIAADLGNLDGYKCYTAGPPVMVDSVTQACLKQHIRAEDIHADPFLDAHQTQPTGIRP